MLDYIDLSIIPTFLLIFARIIAFLMTIPLFSYRTIPVRFRLGLGFFFALILTANIEPIDAQLEPLFIILLVKEVAVGLMIGFIAFVILSIVQIAGGFIDFQMGFAIANVIDPQTGAQSPLIGQYFYMIAILFLLSVDGHHMLIHGMMNSFQFISLDQFITIDGNYVEFIIYTFNFLFVTAFQMAIPLVGSLFLVDVALGMLARTVPQLNVFVVGLPLKITVSFTVLFVFMSVYLVLAKFLFQTMYETMHQLLVIIGGG